MNRTKIDWTDWTWNPVTGCWGPGGTAENPNRCPYCYAWGISARFGGGRILSGNMTGHEHLDPFAPTFHPDRLSEPAKVRKPSKIFVCSMADLFGDWVPDEWIKAVLMAALGSHHTFQFLTKNPKRLKDFNPWPSNCWVGTTVTNQADADERLPWLLQVEAPVKFVSHEPLLGAINMLPAWWGKLGEPFEPWQGSEVSGWLHWAIIGAQTGPGAVKVDSYAVANLVNQYHDAGVPVFMKNNLKPPMGRLIQEFPA